MEKILPKEYKAVKRETYNVHVYVYVGACPPFRKGDKKACLFILQYIHVLQTTNTKVPERKARGMICHKACLIIGY